MTKKVSISNMGILTIIDAIAYIKVDPINNYKQLSEYIKSNATVSLFAIKFHEGNLSYIPEILQRNKVFAMIIIGECVDINIFEYFDESISRDKDVLMTAYAWNYEIYGKYVQDLFNDEDFYYFDRTLVNGSINRDHFNELLECQPEHVRDNKRIIFKEVLNMGSNLKYASDRLKNDKEFITLLAAVSYGTIMKYIGNTLKMDQDVTYICLATHIESIYHIPTFLSGIPELIVVSSIHPKALMYAAHNLKYNREFVKHLMSINGKLIKYSQFTDDPEIINISNNPQSKLYLV